MAIILAWQGAAWAALTLATDHRSIAFGRMELDETKELAQFGSYQNEITCTSTNGQAWYLKVNLVHPLTSGTDSMPLESFQWQAETPDGAGTLPRANEFTPFRLIPDMVYLSGANEADGTAVHLRFKYSLTLPEQQITGVYQTVIRFTLTEVL